MKRFIAGAAFGILVATTTAAGQQQPYIHPGLQLSRDLFQIRGGIEQYFFAIVDAGSVYRFHRLNNGWTQAVVDRTYECLTWRLRYSEYGTWLRQVLGREMERNAAMVIIERACQQP